MSEQASVQSVERAFLLLEILSENGSMGITDLSLKSGLHKTTVFRLLSTICNLGYAMKNEETQKYVISLKFLRIATSVLNSLDMRTAVHPYLETLSLNCSETVHLVQRDGTNIIYIDKVESPINSVRLVSHIGLSLPMIYTAVGKAIMSYLSDTEIKYIWDSTEKVHKTPNTITEFDDFFKEIECVRKQGFAIDNEENETGVRCIAAAIPDYSGSFSYAFSISAPISRMSDERLKALSRDIIKTKNEITG